jgi:hypothetical protein
VKRVAKPLAAASLAALSASCGAQPLPPVPPPDVCSVCAGPDPSAPPLPGSDLLPARFLEVSPFLASHATITKTEPHIRGGGGLEVAVPFARDGRARWLFSQALMYGAWGDQHHGNWISESATGLKVSFLSSIELVDPYFVVTEGFLAGAGALPAGEPVQTGNRLGAGVGLRLFRAFSIEGSGHWIHAFGNPFTAVDDGSSTRNVPDGALSFGVDVCAFGSFCDRASIPQGSDDATCVIYKSATLVCNAAQGDRSNPNASRELCEHAVAALSIDANAGPVLARDAFGSFLEGLEKSEHDTLRAPLVSALSEKNQCLQRWRSCGRRQECKLAQRGQTVATRRVYSPFTIELLSALGCNADGSVVVGQCHYACQEPPPSPPVCP